MSKLDTDVFFTEDEIRLIASRWMFWKGTAIGSLVTLIVLTTIGLIMNK